jgi:type VI secretion system protein ImpM
LAISNTIGFYGKLPAHGDFIHRGLPTQFINLWDAWLQGFIKCSQEQLGENWLDIYLTSPIWRFAFSEGVIDQHAWAGIMLPSVDRVGRYFPFSIAAKLSADENPLAIIAQATWFESLECLALKALDGQIQIDNLAVEIGGLHPERLTSYSNMLSSFSSQPGVIILQDTPSAISNAFASLLHPQLKSNFSSYSVWNTLGSNYVEPCLLYCGGLPAMQHLASLLDGQWQVSGWNQPCQLSHS